MELTRFESFVSKDGYEFFEKSRIFKFDDIDNTNSIILQCYDPVYDVTINLKEFEESLDRGDWEIRIRPLVSQEEIDRRDEILREKGYNAYAYKRTDVSQFYYKTFCNYKYQGDGWQKFASTARNIYALTDVEFQIELSFLPQREEEAKQRLAEFVAGAEERKSIEEGRNAIENQNQADDKQKLDGLVKHIHAMIEANNFKSLKYTNIFSHVLAELDKLK